MDAKDFKYNNEEIVWNTVQNDGINCTDCIHRKPDYVKNGKVIISGCHNRFCEEYSSGKGKPDGVLDGGRCPKYKK